VTADNNCISSRTKSIIACEVNLAGDYVLVWKAGCGGAALGINPLHLDAWVYDKDCLRPVENADAKAVVELPSSGPGSKPQGVNPRQDEMECPGD
jgi:hypothetical protein